MAKGRKQDTVFDRAVEAEGPSVLISPGWEEQIGGVSMG